MAVYATKAIRKIQQRHWNIQDLKTITMVLIICSLVFTTLTYIKYDTNDLSNSKIEAIQKISNSKNVGTIISSAENGYYIQTIAEKKTLLDLKTKKQRNGKELQRDAEEIFYGENINTIEMQLNKHNITHILIDKKMREGKIWQTNNQGLLFFLENSNLFLKTYDDSQHQLYRYTQGQFETTDQLLPKLMQ